MTHLFKVFITMFKSALDLGQLKCVKTQFQIVIIYEGKGANKRIK